MRPLLAAVALAATAASAAPPPIEVAAAFLPPAGGKTAAVEVRFASADPALHVNRNPAPRLELEPLQHLLTIAPPRPAKPGGAPAEKYLGSAEPYRFPVAVAKGAAGTHTVKGTVTYFYCSQRENWCRKGAADVAVAVKLP